MARRASYISNEITGCLTKMRQNVGFAHLQNTQFNPLETALSLLKPMRAGLGRMKADLSEDLAKRMNIGYDNGFLIVVPLPNRISGLTSDSYRTKLDSGYSFMKWQDYKSHTYRVGTVAEMSQHEKNVHMRGMSFEFSFKRRIVPTSWWHPRDFNGTVDSFDEGLIVGPERLGEGWEDTVAQLEKLHDLIVLCEYCYEFGRVASKHCTTPGNTRKVWPESSNFLQSTRGKEIERSLATAWPVDLRRRLADLKGPDGENLEDNEVDTKYVKGQLQRVADMILTSTLMGTPADYVKQLNEDQSSDYLLDEISFTTVNVFPEYAAQMSPMLAASLPKG